MSLIKKTAFIGTFGSALFIASVAFASPVPSISISAIGGQPVIANAVILTVPLLPTTVQVDGTGSINQSTLDGANLALSDNGTTFYTGHYWQGIGQRSVGTL